ncbi:glycogen/starch synthase [Wandonia haliotis]|uniref:starch synthase n=1 Tax=Wandonia haliotis TaxID=574963 RepID=A0ABP3Y1B8_9FLAO
MEKKRVLFVSQEINPFLPKSEISTAVRRLSQGIQEAGKEIRVFMPKFGSINERRHQLHEVIRLSGMNLIIDDQDHPLIIKVASIPSARMQVYFIDNEEYFKRKAVYCEESGQPCADNDERSMFFCRGVLETVKKLGWKPDVIHCNGWMTAFMPMYLKEVYGQDPHFQDTKVIYSLYESGFKDKYCERLPEKLKFDGFSDEMIDKVKEGTCESLTHLAMDYSDGVILCSENVSGNTKTHFESLSSHKLDFNPEETQVKVLSDFIDKVIEEEVLIS